MSNSTQNCTCIESGYAQTTNHCPVHKNSTQNDWENSHDFKQAVYAADILLDTPYADPDDDIRTVARQFNRMVERYNTLAKELADARREVIEEIENKLESIQFVYEHQWTDEAVEKLCERCGEVIKIGTPCEASIHITCWKLLESVLATLRKEEKHG